MLLFLFQTCHYCGPLFKSSNLIAFFSWHPENHHLFFIISPYILNPLCRSASNPYQILELISSYLSSSLWFSSANTNFSMDSPRWSFSTQWSFFQLRGLEKPSYLLSPPVNPVGPGSPWETQSPSGGTFPAGVGKHHREIGSVCLLYYQEAVPCVRPDSLLLRLNLLSCSVLRGDRSFGSFLATALLLGALHVLEYY